jgi:hypothetical protein
MARVPPTPEEAARILASRRTRPARRPPPPAGRALSKLIQSLDDRFGQGPEALKARWREIAGDNLAARSEPVRLIRPRGGGPASLELKVDGPTAALIQHQAAEILARVNLFLGPGAVAKLRIVQGPVRPPPTALAAAKAGRARRLRAQPLDAELEAQLEAGLAPFDDGPLKDALRRLGREVLRQSQPS